MTIRQDIPSVGSGPVVGDYFAVNRATGEYMRLTDYGAARFETVLVVVPAEHLDAPSVFLAAATNVDEAPTFDAVVDLARNERLLSTRPVSSAVRAAIDRALSTNDGREGR